MWLQSCQSPMLCIMCMWQCRLLQYNNCMISELKWHWSKLFYCPRNHYVYIVIESFTYGFFLFWRPFWFTSHHFEIMGISPHIVFRFKINYTSYMPALSKFCEKTAWKDTQVIWNLSMATLRLIHLFFWIHVFFKINCWIHQIFFFWVIYVGTRSIIND